MTTLNLTTITRSEALALILRGLQGKRADIEANQRDLRAQLNPEPQESDSWPELARKELAQMSKRPLRLAIDAELDELDTLARKYPPPKPRRKFSAAARKRMAAAQRARWKKAKAVK